MRWQLVKSYFRNFRYNYKQFFAILFAVLAAVLILINFLDIAIGGIQSGRFDYYSLIDIFNFLVMMAVCYRLISGNAQSSYAAYDGVLWFLFIIIIDFVSMAVYYVPLLISAALSEMSITLMNVIFAMAFLAALAVFGTLAYSKTRQFLNGSYFRYKRLKWMYIAIAIIVVIANFPMAYLAVSAIISNVSSGLGVQAFEVFASGIAPSLADIFLALSILFTIVRLNPDN